MKGFSSRERAHFARGIRHLAGVDEAGRGPLAGPVVAAAVILPVDCRIEGIGDSKALKETERDAAAERIRSAALAWAVGSCSPSEIDEINILQASILAMHRAIRDLGITPGFLLIDGNSFPHPALPFETVVKGDAHCYSIAAASILAKVERDQRMRLLDERYPAYGFARHKGYPTRAHVDALRRLGPTPEHRRSFTVKSRVTQGEIFDDRQTAGSAER